MKRATAAGLFFLQRETPFGALGLVAGEGALVEVLLQPSPATLRERLRLRHPRAREESSPLLGDAAGQLDDYFRGQRRVFQLPMDYSGMSPFMIRVLEALREVPLGGTIGYGQLASRVGHPGAARAVGGVMAANPFPLLIPCHRVLAAGGKPGGYSGGAGLATKKLLLAFEQECVAGMRRLDVGKVE